MRKRRLLGLLGALLFVGIGTAIGWSDFHAQGVVERATAASYREDSHSCPTATDIDMHAGYIERAAKLAGRDISDDQARADIAAFERRGIPRLWWTRFALYPAELDQYKGPFQRCPHSA
jgi:hypothetical protein